MLHLYNTAARQLPDVLVQPILPAVVRGTPANERVACLTPAGETMRSLLLLVHLTCKLLQWQGNRKCWSHSCTWSSWGICFQAWSLSTSNHYGVWHWKHCVYHGCRQQFSHLFQRSRNSISKFEGQSQTVRCYQKSRQSLEISWTVVAVTRLGLSLWAILMIWSNNEQFSCCSKCTIIVLVQFETCLVLRQVVLQMQ